jgi:hypothetical protein
MLGVLCICISLLFPGTVSTARLSNQAPASLQTPLSRVTCEIDIPPGSEYCLRFDASNLTLYEQNANPLTKGLSEKVIAAIAKSPAWIQSRLTSQFLSLTDPESYADLLLNASVRYADEIAFSIACCPEGLVPSPMYLKENAEALYEHDQWISYATIVDYDDKAGNYYSTIRYAVLENGTENHIELPPDIYYWYIVHPKVTSEDIDAEYGPLWRNYLFDHNDIGYPLLKEKLSTIRYLWDGESYHQPGGRQWSICIQQHPTAIEATSYWIGKTVPYPAFGDRPWKSSIIAHEHNGWCGELQIIAVAAQRAALIPTIGSCAVGEDHVWREFYERGWHQNDNWWSDTGGAVNQSYVYAYNWGWNLSAVYLWKGDETILQDTSRYLKEDDRITVDFEVKDVFLQPVDGARVIVLVKGPKDITYYKNLIWEKIQGIWDRLPGFVKGKLLSFLFEKVSDRFHSIPDSIKGVTITTWNYTDSQGRCSLELGKNHDYLFFIQEGNLRKPWQLARHTLLRSLKTRADHHFNIILFDLSQIPQRKTVQQLPSGDCTFNISFTSSSYQLQKHFYNDGIGRHETAGTIECFFVDPENYQNYKEGKRYNCYNLLTSDTVSDSVSTTQQDWFIVFQNPTRNTHVTLDVTVDVAASTSTNKVQMVSPHTTLFENPTFNAGVLIPFSGIASTAIIYLSIDNETPGIELATMNGEWFYLWNTSGMPLGTHVITATVEGNVSDEVSIEVLDGSPPSVGINTLAEGTILEQGILDIAGWSADNSRIDYVDVTVDNITRQAIGTTTWALSWDLTGLPLGDHLLSVKAVDTQGLTTTECINFVLNESGHDWHPQITSLSYTPTNPTNSSNMIICTNVTATGPFAIDQVILYCYNGSDTVSYEMYRYGENPVQSRHEEDPLRNRSNAPRFGIELGQFPTGQMIGFWIVARDTAHNSVQSEGDSFTIT